MVDTLKGLAAGDIVLSAYGDFKVYKVDTKPRNVRYCMTLRDKSPYFVDAKWYEQHTANADFSYGAFVGSFTCEEAHVKSVATTFAGFAKSAQTEARTLARFVKGDKACFDAYIKHHRENKWRKAHVDVADATLSTDPDSPKPKYDVKRFKFAKMDLICAVIAVHGPMYKDDILRRVAALEGKPWVVGSNADYFTINKAGAIEEAAKGERGKTIYHCTVLGWSRASNVIVEIGKQVIEALK